MANIGLIRAHQPALMSQALEDLEANRQFGKVPAAVFSMNKEGDVITFETTIEVPPNDSP